jgi:hypothetical protein
MTTKVVADATGRNGQVRYPKVVRLARPCVLRSIAYQDSPVVSHVGVVCLRTKAVARTKQHHTGPTITYMGGGELSWIRKPGVPNVGCQ